MTDVTDTTTTHLSPTPQPGVAAVVYNPIKVDLDTLRAVVTTQASAAG